MKTISMLAATSVVLAAALAQAEPCTLYKPQDLANACANVARYAWAQSLVNGWRNSVRLVLERDRQFIDEMISPRTPWPTYGRVCPACVGKESSMGETGLYRWRVDNPDRLVCKYCGTVYPNAAYPETGKLVCPRMGQTFTYYLTGDERSHPEDTSGRYAFRWASWPVHTSWSGVIRSHKADYVVGRALPLAKLYALTGEVQYAQRAAWILDRLAAVYPQLLFHSYNGTYADCPPAEAAAELGRHPRGGQFRSGADHQRFRSAPAGPVRDALQWILGSRATGLQRRRRRHAARHGGRLRLDPRSPRPTARPCSRRRWTSGLSTICCWPVAPTWNSGRRSTTNAARGAP